MHMYVGVHQDIKYYQMNCISINHKVMDIIFNYFITNKQSN